MEILRRVGVASVKVAGLPGATLVGSVNIVLTCASLVDLTD